jgi:hypothetical protein
MGWRWVYAQACLVLGSETRAAIKTMPVTVDSKEKHGDAVGFSG